MAANDKKALIVAVSGCSSSGKTTLARLLRDIFPASFILHEDDFYRPETELPLKDGLLDWDCAEAIDVPALADALSYIRQNASLPPSLDSKEDKNSVGKCPVHASTISSLKAKVSAHLLSTSHSSSSTSQSHPHPPSQDPPSPSTQPPPSTTTTPPTTHSLSPPPKSQLPSSLPRICLLDGFLLLPPSMLPIPSLLDLKFLLRTSHSTAKSRRQARDGYVTLEGFWADPPGYVDAIVWPNYAREHAWLFQNDDVQAPVRLDLLRQEGIRVPPGQMGEMRGQNEGGLDAVLEWMVDVLLEELDKYA